MKALPRFDHTTTHFAGEEGQFLVFVTADDPARCGSIEWFTSHREAILEALDHFGVVYFRGFGADSRQFEAFADILSPTALPYGGGVSPRHFVHGTVFTANDSPGAVTVPQHHELSYHGSTPRYVAFYCELPSETGGATPISDGRRFARTISERYPKVMDELEEKGVIFIRNYTAANFKGWEATWQTSDRAVLEAKLRENDTEFEWLADDWLRTRQRRPAIVRDPVTGQRILYSSLNIWCYRFNEQVNTIYHLPLPENDASVQPLASVYGDGSAIPMDFVKEMDVIYNQQKVAISYQPQDIMFINNVIAAHGKTPWTGPSRKVYVTLRDPIHHSHMARLPARSATR